MTNRKLLTTFLFLITDPIHSFYAQSFLFLNYPLRLHPVPRAGRQCGQLNVLGTGGLWGILISSLSPLVPRWTHVNVINYIVRGVWALYVSLSLYSLFQSHSDSYLCGPTDLDAGGVGCTHSLSTTLGPFPDYAHLVQLGGGVSLRSDRFIFIGRQSP